MKIEKINDNQIKCTLTRSDLASHQLRISEIAYGTEKANGLFRDMMDKASLELGFDMDDLPVSIEAIPVSMDCIILMITRLEEPDEVEPELSGLTVLKELFTEALPDEISPDIFSQLESFTQESQTLSKNSGTGNGCLLSFDRLEVVMQFARQIAGCDLRDSFLYKSEDGSRYYLYLEFSSKDTGDYAFASTVALEFGRVEASASSRVACMKEHCEPLLLKDAVKTLASV